LAALKDTLEAPVICTRTERNILALLLCMYWEYSEFGPNAGYPDRFLVVFLSPPKQLLE
jgi:hypothetical protein